MTTKNTSIVLGEELAKYAASKVASGAFGSTSEVVRDALRRAAEHDLRVERLRQLVREGEESGPPVPWNLGEFLSEMHEKYGKDAA
jgi:antitoxin ParD1/3/4